MKSYSELTYLGQVRRLGRLAQLAVPFFIPEDVRLTLIQHGENTTYRVDVADTAPTNLTDRPYVENRYLLRVHRTGYQSAESIASELAWLSALRHQAGLAVPEPVLSLEGAPLVTVSAPGIPEPRVCSLLRWINGRFCDRCKPGHFGAVGDLMARLHDHAVHWKPPTGFTRRWWDWEGLFGDNAGFHLDSDEVWALLPDDYHDMFYAVARQVGQVMLEMGQGPDASGLIHADLHMGNLLFSGGEARPIDFDDCGYGYWVYDFAVALSDWKDSPEWPRYHDSLLEGYVQVRPLPEKQLNYLDLFMAARRVSLMLWATDMAQVNSNYRAGLEGWLARYAGRVRQYLDS
jgi:Ser/Thr protein kinase RdoA (MazF antagonist)